MKLKWVIGFLSVLLSVQGLRAQGTGAMAPQSPEQTVVSFYKWYLHSLAKSEVPTDELDGPIKQYISPALTVSLRRMLRNGDMDSDYFLKAQDFLPDWANNVNASPSKPRGAGVTTEVTLGETSKSRHRVVVNMAKSDHVWKITSVLPSKE